MAPKVETFSLGADSGNPVVVSRVTARLPHVRDAHGGVDVQASVDAMRECVASGITTFHIEEHFGPEGQIVSAFRNTADDDAVVLAEWSPNAGVIGEDACAAAVDRALVSMGVQSLDLLQYHVHKYEDPSYQTNLYHLGKLQAAGKIRQLGVVNMDLLHLRMLRSSGYMIASNRVSLSVLDMRAARTGGIAEWCAEHGVGLFAHDVLVGGFIDRTWLGQPEPRVEAHSSLGGHKRKIDLAGGWAAFQAVLSALDVVARKHGVGIPAVAIRHALDMPGVAGVTGVDVGSGARGGTRLSSSVALSSPDSTDDNGDYLKANVAAFGFSLDAQDRALIERAQASLTSLAGDCGDEYRYPPLLSALYAEKHREAEVVAGGRDVDASSIARAIQAGHRIERSSGSPWEPIGGYCRAVRIGNNFVVAGTTTRAHPSGHGGVIGGASAADQTTNVFDIITAAVHGVGASMGDIMRTRTLLTNLDDWRGVVQVHGATMARYGVRPVNTTVGGSMLIGDGILVEVEAEGVVSENGNRGCLRL